MINLRYFQSLTLHGCRRLCYAKASVVQRSSPKVFIEEGGKIDSFKSIYNFHNVNLQTLKLTSQHLSGQRILQLPSIQSQIVKFPTLSENKSKKFIVETPVDVKEPEVLKREIREPFNHSMIKKHAIRMIVLRRRKMKKHQLKKLWQRMYLKFRTNRQAREKKKEYEFRGMLATKVMEARKFDAEKYVDEYMNDYHTPLLPKTYNGKRLPAWLIKELMEQDREYEEEKSTRGKEYTSGQSIVRHNETVKEFIARNWNGNHPK